MTIACTRSDKLHRILACGLLAALAACATAAGAQTPPAAARFQQNVRQQQVSDQLQKSQQQEQQRQNVANMAQQPLAQDSAARRQQAQAEQAQRDRDNARQQDLVDKYRDAATPASPSPPAGSH